MKFLAWCGLAWVAVLPVSAKPVQLLPESVAVLYNESIPESKKLAQTYAAARSIPEQNLIGLALPLTADISRADYQKTLKEPLREVFNRRQWWRRESGAKGFALPVQNRICVMAVMKGVPLRISPAPLTAGAEIKEGDPISGRNEAAVDSELAVFGIDGVPIEGALRNQFFQSTTPIAAANFPFLLFTSRIDAASYATCERIIRDTIEAEKTGLWGRSYVDIANKFPQGDQWLKSVVQLNTKAGIPTVVDSFDPTYPKNYPMTDAASYFGWYDGNVSGPFLNPGFRFRPGAVALHIHSFSAEQLADANKNWSAALLERGAAATVGNVYEPYLHLTHHPSVLLEKLLAGHQWVDAVWMSVPVTSWQAIALGDPLYRPYLHLADGSGMITAGNKEFRALAAGAKQWANDGAELQRQIEAAAERMQSGILAEAIGLDFVRVEMPDQSLKWFEAAKSYYEAPADRLRQDFHRIAIERAAKRNDSATTLLRSAQAEYAALPEAEAIRTWLDLLAPPPPPAGP